MITLTRRVVIAISRRQKAEGRRQKAEGRRQKAEWDHAIFQKVPRFFILTSSFRILDTFRFKVIKIL
jgi:hypothetical protein